MRNLVMCSIAFVLLGLVVGCGAKEEAVRTPDTVTEEQIREMDQAQQEVDAAEREQRKLNP
ncbi:MAG: hypothetical protein MUE50_04110 [Pirellulaceae bacterium]|nr:hypothetical protein [Pirellulaceae bacterium]MCU0978401.1 hypothetical protein [Pirellulaceae bacterium]